MPNNEFTTLACMCLFACTWWYQLPDTTFRLSRSVETVQLYEYRPLSFPTWHVWTILSDKHCAFAMRVFCSSFFFFVQQSLSSMDSAKQRSRISPAIYYFCSAPPPAPPSPSSDPAAAPLAQALSDCKAASIFFAYLKETMP